MDLSRFAARALRRNRAITFTAIGTLAIAMAVTSTFASLFNAFFLRALPGIRHGQELHWLTVRGGSGRTGQLSYQDLGDLRQRSRSVAMIAGFAPATIQIRGGDGLRVEGQVVTTDFFRLLGVRLRGGRTFTSQEALAGSGDVAVISDGLRSRLFGDGRSAVGQTLRINDVVVTIIGVTEPGFAGPIFGLPAQLWLPTGLLARARPAQSGALEDPDAFVFQAMVRVRPGVSLDHAANEVEKILHREPATSHAMADMKSANSAATRATFTPMAGGLHPSARASAVPLAVLASVVTIVVLLIACSNVANLLLSRALAQRRDVGIRMALGATRARVIRELLAESAMLWVIGSALGFVLSYVVTWSLKSVFGISASIALNPDSSVLLLMLALGSATGLLFGASSAFMVSSTDTASALKADAGSMVGASRALRGRRRLIVAQLGFSLVLLNAAALFLRSIQNASAIDPGFDVSSRTTAFAFDLAPIGYSKQQSEGFYEQLLERVRAVPGVEAASIANLLPFGEVTTFADVMTQSTNTAPPRRVTVSYNTILPQYFATVRIPIVRGREFNQQDAPGAVPAVIVNQTLARMLWPNGDGLGMRLSVGGSGDWREVIGVARDARYASLTEAPAPYLYLPQRQIAIGAAGAALLVRSSAPSGSDIMASVKREFHALDANVSVFQVVTLRDLVAAQIADRERGTLVVAGLGLFALILAALGLYGLVAYSVTQRIREIGLRLALGASRQDVLSLFIREGSSALVAGVVLGVALSLALNRVVRGMLVGVQAFDPVALLLSFLTLSLITLAAVYIPARRASRVDPMTALRVE